MRRGPASSCEAGTGKDQSRIAITQRLYHIPMCDSRCMCSSLRYTSAADIQDRNFRAKYLYLDSRLIHVNADGSKLWTCGTHSRALRPGIPNQPR